MLFLFLLVAATGLENCCVFSEWEDAYGGFLPEKVYLSDESDWSNSTEYGKDVIAEASVSNPVVGLKYYHRNGSTLCLLLNVDITKVDRIEVAHLTKGESELQRFIYPNRNFPDLSKQLYITKWDYPTRKIIVWFFLKPDEILPEPMVIGQFKYFTEVSGVPQEASNLEITP